MGYMMVVGVCFVCKRTFMFNHLHVPSLNGEPFCADCMALGNAKRVEMGLPPHPIHPDAYAPAEA